MKRFDRAMADRIRAAVTAAEAGSAIEIVVRVAPASGGYRDVPWLVGVSAGTIMLAVALFAPIDVTPPFVIPEVALAGALGAWLARRVRLARWLTSPRRRAAQALEGARASFHTEAVGDTRAHTGVLVYASVLEDCIVVLPDRALEGRAPGATWGAVAKVGRAADAALPERLLAVLAALGQLGREHVPCTEEDINELSDEPRIG